MSPFALGQVNPFDILVYHLADYRLPLQVLAYQLKAGLIPSRSII